MHKTYHYSRPYPTLVACLLAIGPALALLLMALNIGLGQNAEETILLLLLYCPVAALLLAPLLWLATTLSARLTVNEEGIELRTFVSKKKLRWDDIASISRKSIFSGTFPSYGPPRDLEVFTTRKKKMNIYYFIKSLDAEAGEESIEEVEAEIRRNMTRGATTGRPD